MVYSSRDTGNYPVSSLLRTSVSYDPANTTPAADSEMTSHSLTMVDETIVHDWQISSVGVGCTAGNQEALLAAYHQPSCTPERPLSAGSASTSWSAASGIESATDEFTVNQHHHHQQQQEKQVSSSRCKAGAKKKRINFFKYILSFTIFRRWKTVHKAEECPSPTGFAMVLQNASGIATTTTSVSGSEGTSSGHCGQQYADAGLVGYNGDGNGNGTGHHNVSCILSSPSSSSSIHSPGIDCNRNRVIAKVS
uniref:Uncharacterized protein n=1 Tax=Anopheles merus TaxID=30066 RepID=A0A182VFJ9_ANOME